MNNLSNSNNHFYVTLSSCIDEYLFLQFTDDAKLHELSKLVEPDICQVLSLSDAKELCMEYINYYELSSSNWSGGKIVDENYNFVARVSFNGRIWDSEDDTKAKEIII